MKQITSKHQTATDNNYSAFKGMRMTCPSAFKSAGTGHSHPLMKKSCPSAFKSVGTAHSP